MIVKRNRPPVGEERPRMIVKRNRGGGVQPPRGPGNVRPRHNWRLERRWLFGLGATFATVATLTAAAWLWQSPVFEVATIEVTGNERISVDTLTDRTGLIGDRMFTADLARAQSRLYELPLVAGVHVERDWPRTIRVIVEERQPWGTWEQAGVTYTIDRAGYVLGTLPPATGSPAIRSEGEGALTQGDRVDYQAVDAAAEIYEGLPVELGTTVSEVAYLQGKGVQVTTTDGQVALFGDSSSISYKLAVWAALQTEARTRGIDYTSIDLRYGNRPVIQ